MITWAVFAKWIGLGVLLSLFYLGLRPEHRSHGRTYDTSYTLTMLALITLLGPAVLVVFVVVLTGALIEALVRNFR